MKEAELCKIVMYTVFCPSCGKSIDEDGVMPRTLFIGKVKKCEECGIEFKVVRNLTAQ